MDFQNVMATAPESELINTFINTSDKDNTQIQYNFSSKSNLLSSNHNTPNKCRLHYPVDFTSGRILSKMDTVIFNESYQNENSTFKLVSKSDDCLNIEAYSLNPQTQNGTLSFLFDDLEFSKSSVSNEIHKKLDKDIEKLNHLTSYYKKKIPELAHPLHSAASIMSNASSRIAGQNIQFKYNDKIELKEKPAPERKQYARKPSRSDIFNPQFNSTVSDNDRARSEEFSTSGDSKMCSTVKSNRSIDNLTNNKRKLSWKEYISSTEKHNNQNTISVIRSNHDNTSNKSLQTLLTMENVTKLSELSFFRTAQIKNNDSGGNFGSSCTFRLSKAGSWMTSAASYRSAEGCCTILHDDNNGPGDMTDAVRARVVNWLVKLDDYAGGSIVTLQCAVSFLDRLVACGPLPGPAMTCGAACYWIASKLQTSRARGAACIARHCAGAFTAKELTLCEQRVLAVLEFPSAPTVAADEVERLMAQLCLDADILQGAHYLCCCALLHARLAITPPDRLAAAALSTTIKLLDGPTRIAIELRSMNPAPDAKLETDIEAMVRAVSAPACACREPFLLYSSMRYRAAALRLAAAFNKPPCFMH